MKNVKVSIIIAFLFMILLSSCGESSEDVSEGELMVDVHSQWETGVALYSFNRFSLSEALDLANEAGTNYVEGFSFHNLGDNFNDRSMMELSDGELQEMKDMIEGGGLKMHSLYAGANSASEWEQYFALSDELGLKFLVGEPEPEYWDMLDSLAGVHGIKIAIHQHAKGESRFWHPDSVLVALEGRPNFGVCGDLGHWVRSGIDPVEALAQLEGHLISIHAKDLDEFGNIEANDVRIGSGVIDYKAVGEELERQDFKGKVYVETEHDWEDNLESVRFAVDYLNRLREDRLE